MSYRVIRGWVADRDGCSWGEKLVSETRLQSGSPRRRFTSPRAVGTVAALMIVGGIATAPAAFAASVQPPVGLGTATSFAVLAGTTVTNTGPSRISGDLGVSPGTAVTGFPPGEVTNGSIHAADAVALQAKNDLTTAYNDAAARIPADAVTSDLGGQTLAPGVYKAASAMGLTGTVTLDAQGDPGAVFIFQAGSTLTTAPNSTVAFINGGSPCNVFWQVGSSATLGTDTTFIGSVLALTSVSVQTGTEVSGRVLARNGQVSLDNNVITRPNCSTIPPTPPPPVTTPPISTPPIVVGPITIPPIVIPPIAVPPITSPGGGDNGGDDNGGGGGENDGGGDNSGGGGENGGGGHNGGGNGGGSGGDNGGGGGGGGENEGGGHNGGGHNGGSDNGGSDNGGGDDGGGDDAAKDMTGPGATGTTTSPGRQIRQVPLGAVDTGVGDIDGSGEMYYLLAGAVILIGTGAVTAGVIRRNRRNT
jgi:hypothetical protein